MYSHTQVAAFGFPRGPLRGGEVQWPESTQSWREWLKYTGAMCMCVCVGVRGRGRETEEKRQRKGREKGETKELYFGIRGV